MAPIRSGINDGPCNVSGCFENAWRRGMCKKHYKRWYRHGDPNKALIDKESKTELCTHVLCFRVVYTRASGLCHLHYQRVFRYGRLENLERHNNTKYKRAYVNGVQDYKHRVLAEKALGKPLPKGAEIHHMNGDRSDNYTPFNLIICPNHAYHLLIEKRTREYIFFSEKDFSTKKRYL